MSKNIILEKIKAEYEKCGYKVHFLDERRKLIQI